MNQVTLIGRVTKDLQMNYTKKGTPVVSFYLAVTKNAPNDVLKDLKEKGKSVTNFIPCVAWNTRAEDLYGYVIKGSKLCVIGELFVESKESADGSYRDIFSVVVDRVEFLDKMNNNESAQQMREEERKRRESEFKMTSDDE